MTKRSKFTRALRRGAAVVALTTGAGSAYAQDSAAAGAAAEDESAEIIVTGTAGGASLRKQDASFAITTISANELIAAAPKSTAEIFTLVPGVWAESSGGKAGANIDVRGLPGGGDAPFVTLAIQGAPIYGTPSLSFFEQSSIFRADETIASVEALRGGPSAVFARGEPGVTLNFRLKEGGDDTVGRIKYTTSDYDLQQIDAVLSGKLADNLYFMVGGYASVSPGIRDAEFNSERGFQITGQLTYRFDRGKLNVWSRWTDDVGQWYLPMSLVSGNDLGTFSQLGNATRFRTLQVNANGDTETFDFKRGRGWKGSISGLNAEFEVADNITLRNNMAYTKGSADTLGLVPSGAPVRVSALTGIVGPIATLSGRALTGTDFVQTYGHWVVEKNLESFSNDLSLNLKLGGNDITIGYFRSSFSSDDFWTLGNPVVLHNVQNGDFVTPNVTPANVAAAGGDAGFMFGLKAGGDQRNNALYVADSIQITDKLRFDAGIRREWATIIYNLDTGPGFPDGTRDLATRLKGKEWSYTAALNYAFSDEFGAFGRYSSGFAFPNFDDIRGGDLSVNGIDQWEAGLKYSSDHLNMFATGFYNKNDSFQNTVGGVLPATAFRTRAYGVELDGALRLGDFRLGMIGTIQDTKITQSSTPAFIGNDVQRQPNWQFRLSPSYEVEVGDWTVNFYGAAALIGKRWSDINNAVRLKGYEKVDLGIVVKSPYGFFGQVFADNVFDSHGLTEGDPRSLTAANGRPILGRSFKFSIGYDF
jgi:iron complex outermembrane recepter protein